MSDLTLSVLPEQKRTMRASLLTRVAMAALLVGAVPSSGVACPGIIAVPATASVTAITAYILAMQLAFTMGTTRLIDALTRKANQDAESTQNKNNASAVADDKIIANQTTAEIASARAEMARDFVPSRTVCGLASQQKRLGASNAHYQGTREAKTVANTRWSLNAPGSGAEKGQLQALNTVWTDRCTRYANPTNMDIPAGLTCPGGSAAMRDLDIQPVRSLFQPLNLDTTDSKQAADDTIRLLTEPAPIDPVRGNALSRADGQNLHVMRMHDVTRMNVARLALEDIASLRASPTTAGSDGKKNSRYARYVELMTGQDVNGNTSTAVMEAITSAAEPQNANAQAVAARLSAQKMMLTEMVRMTDQLITIEAVKLATRTEETRVMAISGGSAGGN